MTQTKLPTMLPKSFCEKDLQSRLLSWFAAHARPMPWRKTKDPYAIWLSETMLQQTQVATVTPYYIKFYSRFPTVSDLAQADLQEVLALWAGLGYYRRAKHLHAAARMIVEKYAGQVPSTSAQLLVLPGVGRYTAAAVASIAFGERIGVLDGNVTRVLARLTATKSPFSQQKEKIRLQSLADYLVPATAPGPFNEAMMELGATICTPARPSCESCPVRPLCAACAQGIQAQLPLKKKPPESPLVRRIAVVVTRGSGESRQVLLMQRPGGVTWEHMWEFPALETSAEEWAMLTGVKSGKKAVGSGGKRESARQSQKGMQLPDFNWLAHFADVVVKQLGMRVELDRWLGSQGHQLTHRTMDYRVLRGALVTPSGGKDPKLPRCERGRYVAFRWEQWQGGSLNANRAQVPMARLTEKIAATAGSVERGEGSAR